MGIVVPQTLIRLTFLLVLFISQTATADCFLDASKRYGVNHSLLLAIAKVESNYNPEALNPDSHALGVMQIMPTNFAALKKYNIQESHLHDPCINIHVGAWILAGFMRQYGPVWRAVGGYGVGNGRTPAHERARVIYADKVQRALCKIEGCNSSRAVSHAKPPEKQIPAAVTSASNMLVVE